MDAGYQSGMRRNISVNQVNYASLHAVSTVFLVHWILNFDGRWVPE